MIQTSAMDCGPASLLCLLQGVGICASYGRLREACQTDVDGTSIDTLEEIGRQLGLDGEQIMLPLDHLFLPEAGALPCLIVTRLPHGPTHFVVIWRMSGHKVQLMDPATGRRRASSSQFSREIYIHTAAIPAAAWREWVDGESFQNCLTARIKALGISQKAASSFIAHARLDQGWRQMARLDAGVRMVSALVEARGVAPGKTALLLLQTLIATEVSAETSANEMIPAEFWMVQPTKPADDGEEMVAMRGAVLFHVRGRVTPGAEEETGIEMSKDLAAVLDAPQAGPSRELWRLLKSDGVMAPLALIAALGGTAFGTFWEAVILQGVIDVGSRLILIEQRLFGIGILLMMGMLLLVWEGAIAAGTWRIGRKLEARLRLAFLTKIPRLGDRYFHSRLISDMTERSHQIHSIRALPEQGARFVRATMELFLTALGILWLTPQSAPVIVTVLILSLGLPLFMQRRLIERDLRIRNHNGALTRFYLDAMLGLMAIRAHGADRPLRYEAEGIFGEWRKACFDYLRSEVFIIGVQAVVGVISSIWLLLVYRSHAESQSGILLLIYWALQLPVLGEEIAQLAQQYPRERNIMLRLLEPLSAPEEIPPAMADGLTTENHSESRDRVGKRGIALAMDGVRVQAAGHGILEDLSLEIPAGSHVAIVGPSGAGKSSLVGLLLGWHRAAEGRVLIDGEELTAARLAKLRHETVWVDPTVQLWNRSLLENLTYGNHQVSPGMLQEAVEYSALANVIEKLPDGLQTVLGEGGRRLSGGEGQRVRLGRAALKPEARLIILDEPFRGLDRQQRRRLMDHVRDLWREATLLCITHDVGETLDFPRVLVVEGGRLVEDAGASELAARSDSRYRSLLDAENEVQTQMWAGESWRRLQLTDGRIREVFAADKENKN